MIHISNDGYIAHDDIVELYNAARKIKEKYRRKEGIKILEEMIACTDAPKVFLRICAELKINKVSFNKVINSGDYMPDIGWYIVLEGDNIEGIGFLYGESENYREFSDLFGISDIQCADDAIDAMESRGIEITEEESDVLFEFVIGFSKEGIDRDMYDYEGSSFQ